MVQRIRCQPRGLSPKLNNNVTGFRKAAVMSTESPARVNKKTGGVFVAVERVSAVNAQEEKQN